VAEDMQSASVTLLELAGGACIRPGIVEENTRLVGGPRVIDAAKFKVSTAEVVG